jgi:hypothetical protein
LSNIAGSVFLIETRGALPNDIFAEVPTVWFRVLLRRKQAPTAARAPQHSFQLKMVISYHENCLKIALKTFKWSRQSGAWKIRKKSATW